MRTNLTYASTACNRTPNICDWGQNGLICYGACNSIIIYDPKQTGTDKRLQILTGHTKRINAVQWVRMKDNSDEKELLSASTDGTAILWSLNDENKYVPVVLKGHENGVNIIESIYIGNDNNELLIGTASVDSSLKLWKRENYGGEFSTIQTINFGRGLCMALRFTVLPQTNRILIACATDNSKVQMYTQVEEDRDFIVIATLKGHENWVRGLDFVTCDDGKIYLASCSQDTYIRLWCIMSSAEDMSVKYNIRDLMHTGITDAPIDLIFRAMLTSFTVIVDKEERYFTVNLESVLCGHEGWVYEVSWFPKIQNEDGTITQPMKLLSSSLDKSMLIWELNKDTNLWMTTVRVGEVGGNTLGFYGSKCAPDGQSIIGHGYLGSFHLWNLSPESNQWEPGVVMGGHSNDVVDIAWEPEGEFLVSVSLDQTTRIHAPWVRDGKVSWHELARPQVHGYDMSCLSILSRYKFVSGAEEKIVRAFVAPSNFVTNFRNICNILDDTNDDAILNVSSSGPKGASVPSLGLSNKAVYDTNNETVIQEGKNPYPEESHYHEVVLQAPPTEENLIQNTLWPEVQKLYGHGYEIFSLATSHNQKLVASACKATTPEHASIIVWDAETWQQKQKLPSHTLTVTQIHFSPDDSKILSVSRDRRLTVFELNLETDEYRLAATTDKKNGVHARIIWCCAWSHDSKYFATGSRDGKAVVWWKNDEKAEKGSSLGAYEVVGTPLELKGESITAIAFAPVQVAGGYFLSLGFETGVLEFYKWGPDVEWEKCIELDQSLAHHLTVKRIFFRPKLGLAGLPKAEENTLQVASCSSDHSVKVHTVYLD